MSSDTPKKCNELKKHVESIGITAVIQLQIKTPSELKAMWSEIAEEQLLLEKKQELRQLEERLQALKDQWLLVTHALIQHSKVQILRYNRALQPEASHRKKQQP